MIFCEPFSFKMIIEEDHLPESFFEIKTCPIPGGIPKLDEKIGRAKKKPPTNQKKKYKCPKCGRGVVVKELQGAYLKTIKQIEIKEEKIKTEEDRKKRLQDGLPMERLASEDTQSKS